MFILIIILFIIILKIELPELREEQNKRDLKVFLCFYTIALVLSLLLAFGIDIPSPLMPIYYFTKDIYGGFSL